MYNPDAIYLIGHSAGAHIAVSLILSSSPTTPPIADPSIARAIRGVIGVEGIYDIDLLLDHFPSDFYRGFVEQAFGTGNRDGVAGTIYCDFDVTSYSVPQDSKSTKWLIAHSPIDDLVDEAQADKMVKGLRRTATEDDYVQADFTSLVDGHDAVLETEPLVQIIHRFVKSVQ